LVVFGTLTVGAAYALGSTFTYLMAPAEEKLKSSQLGTYDAKRFANARDERLSTMIKDIAEGRVDSHWNAAMRGTLVQHPHAENKTQGADNLAAARR